MSARDITAVIGQKTYYEQVGGTKSFQNADNQDVNAYLVKITKAEDKNREGKYALIKSTKQAGATSSSDQYVTDVTYGEQCDLLGKINTANNVTLKTRTFDGTAPVDNPNKAGAKKPEETTGSKAWDLEANKGKWQELGATVPSDVTTACSAKPPATPGSAPAVSKVDLGKVNAAATDAKVDVKFDKPIVAANADESISVKVNGPDKSLASDGYAIAGDTLSINKKGIDALGITNDIAANKLIVNADQVADKADPMKKNVATGELALQAKAPAAAPDANPTANITTPPAFKFSKTGPIELTFENSIQLATGKALDDSTIGIYEVDAAGTVKRDTKQTGLQYKFKGNQLIITRPPNSEFTSGTKYRIVIASDILLNDDRKAANAASITYDFEAITPKK
jgi:hypothetical protein